MLITHCKNLRLLHCRIGIEALGHLVANNVDESLENRLHVYVLLGAGLEKL